MPLWACARTLARSSVRTMLYAPMKRVIVYQNGNSFAEISLPSIFLHLSGFRFASELIPWRSQRQRGKDMVAKLIKLLGGCKRVSIWNEYYLFVKMSMWARRRSTDGRVDSSVYVRLHASFSKWTIHCVFYCLVCCGENASLQFVDSVSVSDAIRYMRNAVTLN